MRMLEEITRIKTLMSLTEAINPMTEIFLGSYISKAWTAMKKDLGDIDLRISQNLDATLDNVTRTTLDDLAKQQGISSPASMDSLYLINSLRLFFSSVTGFLYCIRYLYRVLRGCLLYTVNFILHLFLSFSFFFVKLLNRLKGKSSEPYRHSIYCAIIISSLTVKNYIVNLSEQT